MARRGEALSEHILFAAKDVFVEMGFERASMDAVAARAATSKRSLYAHFESKEKLFLAVIDLVRDLFLARLRTPADYGGKPAEALTLFCARYLDNLLYAPSVRMCRMVMAEAERFPEGAARHFDIVFKEPTRRMSVYLVATFGLSPSSADAAAQELVGKVIHPRWQRGLFGVDALQEAFAEELTPQMLTSIRRVVDGQLERLADPTR